MNLSEAPAGASFRVLRVILGREVGKRLADMGFTEGTEGAVVRGGFMHGPLQVRIRGYDILIRQSEAAGIEVEPIGDWTAVADAARWFGRGHHHGHGTGWGHARGPGRGRSAGTPHPGWGRGGPEDENEEMAQ